MEIEKVKAYMSVIENAWDRFGLPTILLVFLMSLWIGWLPSPLSEAKDIVEKLKTSLEVHADNDAEILFYLRETCRSNATLASRPLETCSWRAHP